MINTDKELFHSVKESYTLHVSVSHIDTSTGGNPVICSLFLKMLPEMWSSMRRWFLGSLTAEKNEQNVANPRQKDHSVLEASAGEKQENGPTPAKKTTMLILMAPPKDLQQVLLAILDKKKRVENRVNRLSETYQLVLVSFFP